MKKLKLLLLPLLIIFLGGCSTFTYIGDDYDADNVQTVKTDEDFVFEVYKKPVNNKVNIKMGISKTSIAEIIALYVQVDNYSEQTPYTFKVEDLRLSTESGEIRFITSNNYLDIYQSQETASLAQMSSMGTTLTAMTGMMANYNDYNQGVAQNAAQQTSASAFNRMEELGNQILKHSIKLSSVINPRKSQYFYFFFENTDETINVNYKNLNYKFKI